MEKFKYGSSDYEKAVEWSKSVILENGRSLYDVAKSHSSESSEFLSFVNKYIKK